MVRRIGSLESGLQALSEDQLRKQSLALRYRVQCGEPTDHLLPEAYALVRESSRRHLGMRHFDVQLMGGIAMHFGSVAEMQTGEGKTLTASLPLYLAALSGNGAHLATANDYLATRDSRLIEPLFRALGMSVGVICADTPRAQRIQAYNADVTYGTAKEFGFDFLRDRLLARNIEFDTRGSIVASLHNDEVAETAHQGVQRGLHFVLVDEADALLIDEARTPLVVSSLAGDSQSATEALCVWSATVVPDFEESTHFDLDETRNVVTLTRDGRRIARQLPHPESIADVSLLDIYAHIELGILANRRYILDRHYVVKEGEIVIVDEFTGRLAEGRKWRGGIHQAIEAKEGVEISVDTGQAARITIQNFFIKYDRLAGMTGTTANSARELRKIYDLSVEIIPTNKPPRRQQWSDRVYATAENKWNAIVKEIEQVYALGRPVLVGTRSIDKSERLSALLNEKGIPHETLNARNVAREAEIVTRAGEQGKVTVATNMAGRGTDIKLGDNVNELGGIHVICSELHESARIDRQLIGRCGRQGDAGTYRQFMALDDDIVKVGLGLPTANRLRRYENSIQALNHLAPLLRKAQRRVERKHFVDRRVLMESEEMRQKMQRQMGQDPYLDSPT